MSPVGNDIVDLTASGNLKKSGDGRFLSRVFTKDERDLIADAARPDVMLWALWAAKEASYKAVSRGDPSVCSIPRQYLVVLGEKTASGTTAFSPGKVITPLGELALRIAIDENRVHALTAGSEAALDRLCQRVEELEGANDPSIFIRDLLLRAVAHSVGCVACDLSFVKDLEGPGVPRLLFRGYPLPLEVSLSHDGRFAAFVFDPFTLPASTNGASLI